MNNIIEILDLKKNYSSVEAVKGISLEIHKGEMFALVGPDGAGKTTTIRMLTGLISPDSGKLSLLGKNIKENKNFIQNKIGYLSQKFSLYGDLTIDENIEFFAHIHNIFDYSERRNELLEFTRLTPFRDRLADNLSGGMKQKLALACSLIHRPEILFLDEPTTGVDPVSRRDFWKILSGLIKDGITILMTTPYLDEAERCTRVALMNDGKIIALDTPAEIKKSIGKSILEVVCSPSRKAYKIIKESGDLEVQLFGDRLNIMIENRQENIDEIMNIFNQNEIKISGTRIITPTLENVFIHLINN
ncbi:MAG: ABC transporter ATP-binding protein [Ignavibacteria bacterium]|nr:ABC transporter ATP-binding protein [Ignavibacteria bacterium]